MNFAVSLILPRGWVPGSQVKPPVWDHTTDMVDDSPDRPLFLARAADVFSANGVRLAVRGFFKEPLPVSTDVGLVYFLEDLPGLIRFLTAPSTTPYVLGLWEQGIQTEFLFSTAESDDIIEVVCAATADREMDHNKERLPRRQLASQIAEFVEKYREALRRYVPELLGEAWNRILFAAAAELAETLPPRL